MNRPEVSCATVLDVGLDEVWTAISTSEGLSRWFGAAVDIERRLGGRAEFAWPDGSRRAAIVEALEEGALLVLRWLPFGRNPAGHSEPLPVSVIRFELEDLKGRTRLTVRETERVAGGGRFESHDPVFLQGPTTRCGRPMAKLA